MEDIKIELQNLFSDWRKKTKNVTLYLTIEKMETEFENVLVDSFYKFN